MVVRGAHDLAPWARYDGPGPAITAMHVTADDCVVGGLADGRIAVWASSDSVKRFSTKLRTRVHLIYVAAFDSPRASACAAFSSRTSASIRATYAPTSNFRLHPA